MTLGLFEKLGVNIALPEISLDSFDTSLLIKLTESLKEEKFAEGNKISLNLFGYGEVVMLTDQEYNLQKIEIASLDFEGVNVAGGIDSKINCEIPAIEEPHNKEEIVDVSNITSLITSVDTLLNKGYVSGVANLNVYDASFEAKYHVDFKDFNDIKAYFETEIASQKLIAIYQNEKVYVAYDGYKYYVEVESFDIDDIVSKVEELIEKFGYSKDDISKVEVPEIDTEEIKSSLNDFVLNANEVKVGFDKAILQILLKNKEFSSIKFTYDDFVDFSISLDEEIEKEKLNLDEFVAIEKLESKINVVLNQLKEKKVATKLNVTVDGSVFETTLFIDLNNGFKARMFGDVAGYSYDVIYKDNFVYLNVNELKIKYEIPEMNFETLLNDVENLLQQYIPNFEIPQVEMTEIESLVSEVDFVAVLGLVSQIDFKVIDAKQDILKIDVNDFVLSIDLNNDKLANINMAFDNYALNIEILSNDFEIKIENKYVRINEVLEYIPAIIDFAKAKKYEFATTITLGDIVANVTGRIDLTSDFKAQVLVEVEGYNVQITYINEMVYVDYAGKTIVGTIDEIMDLISNAIPEKDGGAGIDSVNIQNFDILKDIVKEGNLLEIALNNGLVLMLNKEEDKLTGFGFAYENYELVLELSTFDGEITHTSGEEIYLEDIVDVIESIVNFANEEKISGTIEVEIDDLAVEAKYAVDFNNYEIYFETEIASQKLVVMYESQKIYVAYDEVKYFIEMQNVDFAEVLSQVEEILMNYGIEIPQVEIPEMESVNVLGILMLVKDFDLTKEEITIEVADIEVKFMLENKKLHNLSAVCGFANVNVTLNEEIERIDMDEKDFVSIQKLFDKVSSIVEEIKEKRFATELTVTIDGEEISTILYIDLSEELKARVTGEIGELSYDVRYIDGYIYLNINEFKVKYELPNLDLNEFMLEVETIIQQYVPEFNLPEINIDSLASEMPAFEVETILGMLGMVKIVTASRNFVEIAIQELTISISMIDEGIEGVNVKLNENETNAKILSNDFELNAESGYVRINEVLEYIPAIIDFAKAKKYEFATTIILGDIVANVTGRIDITSDLKAQVVVDFKGEKLVLTYIDNVVYVDYRTISIKGSLAEIQSLIEKVMPKTETQETISVDLKNLNILKDIVKSGNMIEIILTNGLNVSLEKENGKLTGLGLAYEDYELALELATFNEDIVYTENKNVLNVVELYDFANVIADFVMNEDLAFELEFSYKDLSVTGKVMYAENKVTAYIETTIANRVLMLIFKDNQIYANFDGLGITCKVEEINDLIEYVTTYAGVELPKIETKANVEIDFNDIFNTIIIALENEILSIGFDEFVFDIVTNGKLTVINAEYEDIVVKLTPCEYFTLNIDGNYIDLYEVKELSRAVYNSMKNLSISGTIEVTLELFGEDNLLSIDYAIGYRDNKIMGYVETEFKGLSVNAYIDGEDIYLNVVGLQMHFDIKDMQKLVDWINETFEANLSLDFIDETIENLKDIKLDMITSVVSNEGTTYVTLKNGTKINIVFDEYLETITFIDGTREAIITCTDFSLVNLDNLKRADYRDYTEFTPVIASVYNYALSMQYDLDAEATVYYNDILTKDIKAALQLDVTDGLNAYAYLEGLGEDIVVNYQEKKLYFCYAGTDGLKIAIGEEAIQEIAAILLSAMGIDTSTIPFLDEVLKNENLDTDNLGSVLPKVEFGNPLSYLEYINNFEVTDEYFALNIKGEKISEHAAGKDVSIKIYYKAGKLTHVAVTNLYTSANEYVNINIKVNNFTGIAQLDTVARDKYIDLTNSKDLVKALVHTSQLNDYHIKGKINLTIDFLAEITAATLNVDARVQRKEVEKTYFNEETGKFVTEIVNELTGVIVLDNYPLISVLNSENTNGGVGILAYLTGSRRYRSITIVLKDGYAYVMTEDEEYEDYEQLTRATKVTTDFLLGNISYYIKYLLGFVDGIQTKIDDMIQQSMTYNGPINYGKIIDSYKMNGRTHTIGLNMAEIAHNDQIGLLTLDITTKNDAETNYKDYLYKLDLSVVMLGGMITIATDPKQDTSLYLIDIGKTVDMTVGEKFINDYDEAYDLGFDGEWVKEGANGSWRQANSGTITITYNSNGTETTSSGNISSKLELPRPDNYSVREGNVVTEYKFVGWYTDPDYTKKFTADAYPRYNTTLYAKWEVASVNTYVTITFVTNEETLSQSPLTKFAGSTDFTIPTLGNVKYEPDENTVVLKTFLGWYTADGSLFTSKTFPTEDTTLYAKWKEEITETYNLEIYFDDEAIFNSDVPAGVFESNILTQYDVFFDQNGNVVNNFEITCDTTWIAKNEYKLVVSSQYGKDGAYLKEETLYNGDSFTLPSFASYEVDMTTYIIEYTFLGYYLNGDKTTFIPSGTKVMSIQNATYIAQWKAEEYCYISFDTTWAKPSGWLNGGLGSYSAVSGKETPTPIEPVKVARNKEWTATGAYNSSCAYTYKAMGVPATYTFFVASWNQSGSNTCEFRTTTGKKDVYHNNYTFVPKGHTTLNAHWDASRNW